MKNPALLLILLLWSVPLTAQKILQGILDVKKVEIPFEYQNNLLVVKVMFNSLFPLNFIFDTGAEHTILAKREYADVFRINYEREFKLLGSDMQSELTAYLARGISLSMGNMVIPSHSMLVLDDDYFHFEEITGIKIHGILGADIFKNLVVRINYDKKVITLQKANYFEPPDKGFHEFPLDVFRNKPYIDGHINIRRDSSIGVKLLLDSGASLALLIHTNTDSSLHLPPNAIKGNIGAGLGGYLEGYLGRLNSFRLGDMQLNEVLTNFQELQEGIDTSLLHGRKGIIGNQILSRFYVIIDYPREKLYLKPNKRYKESFEFDKSGLVIIASGKRLNTLTVHEVLAGSPAAEAGILPGDEIVRINLTSAAFLSMADVTQTFMKKEGKKTTMVIKRDGKKLKFFFRLRKII